MIRVTIWNEFEHERMLDEIRKIYPEGIHGALKAILSEESDINVRCATLDEPDQGLFHDASHGLQAKSYGTSGFSRNLPQYWGRLLHRRDQCNQPLPSDITLTNTDNQPVYLSKSKPLWHLNDAIGYSRIFQDKRQHIKWLHHDSFKMGNIFLRNQICFADKR